ncbi:phenylalanine--tRNA ligase subunit beta [Candidatus Woesearchaeota archaeon]|nr:phenylalanine--tRNA ligase subunit beta [Candidatus Woesearchaeota archaeon]
MPTITLNRKVFERIVGKKLSDNKLKDRISMLGTDLEELGKEEIIVEVFPNRPDLLSEQGFSRAFSTFIGAKRGLSKFNVYDSKQKVIIDKNLKDVRPYTACAIARNLKLDDEKIREIIQVQEKLHITYGRNRKKVAIGIYPLEKIKLPITFKAEDPKQIVFQPLEWKKEINALEILEKHPIGQKYGHLLDAKTKFPVFRDANGKVLSVPPIINSHDVGKITEKTKEVFIECSGFDFDVLHKALNMIVTTLHDMGARIESMTLDYPDKKRITPILEPRKIRVDLNYVNKYLGTDIDEKGLKKYLEMMGFGYENKQALIPSYRADVLHQIDLVEDVAIAYGYENFEEVIPNVATIGQQDGFESFKTKISEMIAGLGFLETSTYLVTNKEHQTKLMNLKYETIELANSLSEEYDSLRFWMIPILLDVLASNKHQEYPQNLYEAGWVFTKDNKQETGILEQNRLGVVLCGPAVDYTKIRQVIDLILNYLEIKYTVESIEHDSFIKGRVARVKVNEKGVAYIGEISPRVLENFCLEMPVAALELNLSEIYKTLSK